MKNNNLQLFLYEYFNDHSYKDLIENYIKYQIRFIEIINDHRLKVLSLFTSELPLECLSLRALDFYKDLSFV